MRNSVAHLFLRVVRGLAPAQRHQRRRRAPAFYVVNALPQEDGTWALPWPAPELLAWAWQRWEVEVWRREMKSDAGDIMTMPGLGKVPAAERIGVGPDGRIIGLD